MSSQIIEEQHKLRKCFQKVCRLCLSEEMLEDMYIFKQDEIIRQISALLSIVVSEDDQISRSICAICRARLYEFHNYKLSCLEVQDVLGQIPPSVEEDFSALEIKSELLDELCTEDLLEEMKILPDDIELNEKILETVHIEEHNSNHPVRQVNLPKSKKKRFIYDIKKNYVTCTTCRKKVKKSGLNAHRDKHRFPNYICERDCIGMKFECRQTQLQHYVDVHGDRPVKCKVCHQLFGAKSSLQYHNKTVHQTKRYQCEICKNLYLTRHLLGRHMKVHSAQMDYNCSKCEYATSIKHNLNRHMRMHARKEKEKKQVRCRTVQEITRYYKAKEV